MRGMKSVEIPLRQILCGLHSAESKYIVVEGVRINVFQSAARLIESLLEQADDAMEERREFTYAVYKLITEFCNLVGLTLDFDIDLDTTDFADEEFDADDEDEGDDQHPKATVVSAVVDYWQD